MTTIDTSLTIVTALIKPNMEGMVVRALHDLPEFPGFSLTKIRGQGRGRGRGGAYFSDEYDLTYQVHLQLQVVCRSEIVRDICRIIAAAAYTGHKGDGIIFTTNAGTFMRIRDAGGPAEELPA